MDAEYKCAEPHGRFTRPLACSVLFSEMFLSDALYFYAASARSTLAPRFCLQYNLRRSTEEVLDMGMKEYTTAQINMT